MKRPSTRTMILGHPLVALPVTLGGAGGIYVCCLGGSQGLFPGLAFGAMVLAAAQAHQQVSAYRQWEHDWNAMAANPVPRTGLLKRILGVGLCFALVFGGYAVLHADHRMTGHELGQFVLLGSPVMGLLVLVSLVRWLRRRPRRATPIMPVTVVAKTILPAPPLDAAYAALPEYCQRLLARSGS